MKVTKTKQMPAKERRGRKPLYPFDQLKPGKEFTVRGDDKAVRRLRSAASQWVKNHAGVDLTVEKIRGGARCVWVVNNDGGNDV